MNRLNAQKELEMLFNDLPRFLDDFQQISTPIVFNHFTLGYDTLYIRKDKKGYHLCYSGLNVDKIKLYNDGFIDSKNNGYHIIKSVKSYSDFDSLVKIYKKFVRFLVRS